MFREVMVLDDAIEELSSLAVLHHDVDVAVVDIRFVESNNVGVIDSCQDSHLCFEMLDLFLDFLAQDRFDSILL